MLLVLIGAISLVALVVGIILAISESDNEAATGAYALALILFVVAACGLVACIVTPIAIHTSTQTEIAELQAFQQANAENYAGISHITRDMLSKVEDTNPNAIIGGSIELLEQGGAVSARYAEWRDAVNDYNRRVARLDRLKSNIWIGVCSPGVPDELTLIKIDE